MVNNDKVVVQKLSEDQFQVALFDDDEYILNEVATLEELKDYCKKNELKITKKKQTE